MIRNFVFDLGNVLLSFKPAGFLKKRYDDEMAENLLNCVFKSKEWLMLDKGTIDNAEAVEIIAGRCPEYYDAIKDVIYNWTELLVPIDGSVEILKSLKEKGYNTYLLSNFHKEAFSEVFAKYEFFKHFDGRVISSDVYMLKPEKEIFINLCDKYGFKPEESVFIDDTAENIEACEEVGFKGICFKNAEDLKQQLESMGCKI